VWSPTAAGRGGNVSRVRGQDTGRQAVSPRLSHAQRRRQLLDAAACLIIERSLDAVTMEGVAARAGVSKALPYRFFTNRDDLLMALYDREAGILTRRMREATRRVDGFEPRVRAIVETWLEGVSERGLVLGMLVLASPLAGPIEARRQHVVTALAREWGGAVARELGIDEHRAQRMMTVVLVGGQALIPLWLQQPDDRKTLIDDFVGFVVAGVGSLVDATVSVDSPPAT
jgi:AcrR family transcriptional regulator